MLAWLLLILSVQGTSMHRRGAFRNPPCFSTTKTTFSATKPALTVMVQLENIPGLEQDERES
jgi:hypothetical protein